MAAEVGDAGVQDRAVQLPPLLGVGEHAVHLVELRQVGGDGMNLDVPLRLELLLERVEAVLAPRHGDDVRPVLACELARQRLAQPRGGARDEDPAPPELHGPHVALPGSGGLASPRVLSKIR